MKGLLIKEPWIDKILNGKKCWEIRGSNTKIRGTIALIRSGSGTIVGTAELIDVIGPLSRNKLKRSESFHAIPPSHFKSGLPYPKTFAWSLANIRKFKSPIPYKHPKGAVIWINLPSDSIQRIRRMDGKIK
jgi:hypothetical protein